MSPVKRRKDPVSLSVRTQQTLWSDCVRLAVTHNSYEVETQIKVLSWLNDHEHQHLLDFADSLSSAVYDDARKHYLANQLAALIRKFPHLTIAIDPEAAARETLRAQEHKNRRTNIKLRLARKRVSRYDAILHYMRNYIIKVLSTGEPRDETGFRSPEPPVKAILEACTLTGGAAVGVHGNATNAYRKISVGKWSVTPDCFLLAQAAVAHHAQLVELFLPVKDGIACWDSDAYASAFSDKVELVDANIGSFVAKTAKTHRGIAVEPLLNLFVQTGINAVLRKKLARHGIHLNDQSINQELALHASAETAIDDDAYCTIDLSNASDSLTTELVRDCLPEGWFSLLDRARSRYTRFHNEKGYGATERFCSMGNGFCFPLQSLIYASIVYAAAMQCGYEDPCDFAVYGDDLIVRKKVFQNVVMTLKSLGFSVNRKKTFCEGPFRESCGVDAYSGQDVRPIFIDGFDTLGKVFNIHNQSIRRSYATEYFAPIRTHLRRWAKRYDSKYYCVCPYDPAVKLDEDTVVDGAFWVPFDEAMSHRYAKYHSETWSWSFKLLLPSPGTDHVEVEHRDSREYSTALLWAALTGGSSTAPFVRRYSPRFRLREYWGPSGWLPS